MANEIATTIAQQLGGAGRIAAMTGAKDFCALPSGLSWRWSASPKNRSQYVKITLTDDDLYTVEFGKLHKHVYKPISKHVGIYNDMLKELIESESGFYLSL